MRLITPLVLALSVFSMAGLSGQESNARICGKCQKKVETDWKYCPYDGCWLEFSKGEILDYKQDITKGGLRIELTSFRIGKPKVKTDYKNERELSEELAVVKVKLSNITDVKKIDYSPPLISGRESPVLEDEYGNRYNIVRSALNAWAGVDGTPLKDRALNPDQSHEDVFLFELPVNRAAKFTLTYPAKSWGAEGQVKISFPRELK